MIDVKAAKKQVMAEVALLPQQTAFIPRLHNRRFTYRKRLEHVYFTWDLFHIATLT